jgi:hypothetical protein
MKTSLVPIAGFITLISAAAAAPPEKAPGADEVLNLMESGRFSQALRTAAKAAEAHPQDAQVHFLYGAALMSTLQYKEAEVELKKTIELAPGLADAHYNLGLIKVQTGDEAAAQKYLERALELDPGHPDARREFHELVVRQRIRKQEKAQLTAGSAAEAVFDFLALVDRGRLEYAFDRFVDPAVLAEFSRKVGGSFHPTQHERRELLSGFVKGWNSQILSRGGEYVGFEVQPEEAAPGPGGVDVQSYVLVVRTTTQADVERMKRFIDSPALARFISPDVLVVFQGLEPKDRQAMFDRLAGQHQNQLWPVRWVVHRDDRGRWRIRDVVLGSADLVELSLTDILNNVAAFAEVGDPGITHDFQRDSSSYEIGKTVGRIVAVIIGIIIVIRLVRRYRKDPA